MMYLRPMGKARGRIILHERLRNLTMSPRQVIELKTGKKCPRNGIIMAPIVGTRARERINEGLRSGSRARM